MRESVMLQRNVRYGSRPCKNVRRLARDFELSGFHGLTWSILRFLDFSDRWRAQGWGWAVLGGFWSDGRWF